MAKGNGSGFASDRLDRIPAVYEDAVAAGRLAGAQMAILRDDKPVFTATVGYRDKTRAETLPDDALYCIYSMTKPIVTVAAMMLFEEGRFLLNDPVSDFIPAFRGVRVGVESDGGLRLVEARREPTVQDLMRHTSGLIYAAYGSPAIARLYAEAGITGSDEKLESWVDRLAGLPLAHQPGTAFDYSHATDVLGRVVEVVSGQPLDRFIESRITTPLRMHDTSFAVPRQHWNRIAEPLDDPATGKRPAMRDPKKQPVYLSGGGGLISSAADYQRFTRMLLGGGELEGVRLLSPRTVAYMTSDHLGPISADTPSGRNVLGPGVGFGLGFAVRLAPGEAQTLGSVGEFNWGGIAGTHFFVDPAQRLIAMVLFQQPNEMRHYTRVFRNLVYQAMVE